MPVVAELAAWLVAFAVFCLAWMLLQGYRVSLGLLLGKIADETQHISIAGIHPFGWLARDIRKIDHYILYYLGQVVQGSSNVWHALVGQMAAFVHETMDALADLSEAAAHEFWHLRRWLIPAEIAAAVGPLRRLIHALTRRVDALAHDAAHVSKGVTRVVTHEVVKQIIRVEKVVQVKTQAAAVAAVGAAGAILPRLGHLEREVKGIDATLRDALRRVSPAVLVGVVAATVARLGLSWARCSGAQRYGKQLCGMDQGMLDSLIADTLLVLGTISLVEFAQGMQGLVEEAAGEIGGFWRA